MLNNQPNNLIEDNEIHFQPSIVYLNVTCNINISCLFATEEGTPIWCNTETSLANNVNIKSSIKHSLIILFEINHEKCP